MLVVTDHSVSMRADERCNCLILAGLIQVNIFASTPTIDFGVRRLVAAFGVSHATPKR